MGKLEDVYSSVENPLDNEELLKKIVSEYSNSDRTCLIGSSNLYSSLVKMNQTKDSSEINLDDKEVFLIETYNQWIENMLSLDDAHIQYLESSNGMDARKMKQYLKSFGKVSSMDDINRLKSNSLFDDEINGWELQDGWEHIKSQYISGRTESRIPVKHRLYVGCQNQDMWKLAQLFKSKCEEQQIPFYFKLGSSSERDDKMVIYADTDNLGNYISALQEIAQENPEIMQRCGEPPALTGKIDGWIGIGDEPPLKENGKKQSYNELRADIFENAIEEALISDIIEFKGKDVTYKGKQTVFNDLFMEQAAQTIIDKLNQGKDSPSTKLSNYGLREEDLSNAKFKEHIKSHLKKEIQKGLNKLIEVKDKKAQLLTSNNEAIFSIPTREGKSIAVSTNDMDAIIKGMVPIIQEVDPTFMDKVKGQIQEKCRQNGIDDTFCFQQGSKERFEQIDSAQSVKTANAETPKTINAPQTNQQSEKTDSPKMKFVKGFIQAYNDTEEDYQYEKRANDDLMDIKRLQDIIETNGMNRMLTSDLDGKWIGRPGDEGFKVQYSQKQVSAMARLLKVAQLLTESKKLNPEGRNYLEEFTNIPDIEYKLNQMHADFNDENSYMYELRQRARDNRANGVIPSYPQTQAEIDASDNSSSTVRKGLKHEMGTSNKKPEELKVQIPSSKLQISNVKATIPQSKVTTSEIKQQTKAMDDVLKVKILMFKQRSGTALTDEERILIDQHIRQTNEARERFRNQQSQKKSNGHVR